MSYTIIKHDLPWIQCNWRLRVSPDGFQDCTQPWAMLLGGWRVCSDRGEAIAYLLRVQRRWLHRQKPEYSVEMVDSQWVGPGRDFTTIFWSWLDRISPSTLALPDGCELKPEHRIFDRVESHQVLLPVFAYEVETLDQLLLFFIYRVRNGLRLNFCAVKFLRILQDKRQELRTTSSALQGIHLSILPLIFFLDRSEMQKQTVREWKWESMRMET